MKRKTFLFGKHSTGISIFSATTIILLILSSSCDLLFMGVEKKYPRYTPCYAWQLCLEKVWDTSNPYTEGQYMYLREREDM